MEKTFVVDLENPSPEEEDIEDKGKNIMRVQVQLPSTVPGKPGEMVSGEDCIVEVALSREARLIFGIELIRS